MTKTWTMRQLKQELRGFEDALRSAGHRDSSVDTYVGRSEIFLRWLDGDYVPRGGNTRGTSRWSKVRAKKVDAGRLQRSSATPGQIELGEAELVQPFDFRWPSGTAERFVRGQSFPVKAAGRTHQVRIAVTSRDAFGRARPRAVVWVDGQISVEGVGTDSYDTDRTYVSVLRINGRHHVKTTSEVPAGYQSFDLVPFDSSVTGPNTFTGYAVRIREDDLASWARHALLRQRSKGPRR